MQFGETDRRAASERPGELSRVCRTDYEFYYSQRIRESPPVIFFHDSPASTAVRRTCSSAFFHLGFFLLLFILFLPLSCTILSAYAPVVGRRSAPLRGVVSRRRAQAPRSPRRYRTYTCSREERVARSVRANWVSGAPLSLPGPPPTTRFLSSAPAGEIERVELLNSLSTAAVSISFCVFIFYLYTFSRSTIVQDSINR